MTTAYSAMGMGSDYSGESNDNMFVREIKEGKEEASKTYDKIYGKIGKHSNMYYPLKSALFAAERPQIRFSCIRVNYEDDTTAVRNRHTCYFPCPANIAFGDAANLSSIDLGVLGAVGSNIMADRTGINTEQLNMIGDATIEAMKKSALKGVGAAFGDAYNKGMAVAKVAENPFTNTTYQGANVRTFTFNFKMIAESQRESDMIQAINHFFRVNMYGGAEKDDGQPINAWLQYPPVWEIDFLQGLGQKGAKMNPYLPKIFSCYLGGFNSTFNTTSAAWHKDGAPLEVDISLTFQETRALTQADIYNLNSIKGNYYGSEVENMRKRGIGIGGKAQVAAIGSIENFKPASAPDNVANASYTSASTENVDLGAITDDIDLSGINLSQGSLGTGQNLVPFSVDIPKDVSISFSGTDLYGGGN